MAWTRTACAVLGTGLALIKLDDVTGGLSGVTFLILAFMTFAIGTACVRENVA